ncbi:voltage-dependent calcium channel subunit alpha-2/delta-3-like, partial [Tropilaelaps mercedesae]
RKKISPGPPQSRTVDNAATRFIRRQQQQPRLRIFPGVGVSGVAESAGNCGSSARAANRRRVFATIKSWAVRFAKDLKVANEVVSNYSAIRTSFDRDFKVLNKGNTLFEDITRSLANLVRKKQESVEHLYRETEKLVETSRYDSGAFDLVNAKRLDARVSHYPHPDGCTDENGKLRLDEEGIPLLGCVEKRLELNYSAYFEQEVSFDKSAIHVATNIYTREPLDRRGARGSGRSSILFFRPRSKATALLVLQRDAFPVASRSSATQEAGADGGRVVRYLLFVASTTSACCRRAVARSISGATASRRDHKGRVGSSLLLVVVIVLARVDADPATEHVLHAIRMSSGLDNHFRANRGSDPYLSFQFFCSHTGFLRLYPAVQWPDMEPDMYECRSRSWYVQAAASAKDIVILLDVSGSMTGLRKEIARNVVVNILETLTDNDFVQVLTVSTGNSIRCPFTAC